MKKSVLCALFAFVVVTFAGCGGQEDLPPQKISLKLVSVDDTSVRIGVTLNRGGWFNLTLANRNNPIIATWVSTSDKSVGFINLEPGANYEAHGMTFNANGEQTSDDWLMFSTPESEVDLKMP